MKGKGKKEKPPQTVFRATKNSAAEQKRTGWSHSYQPEKVDVVRILKQIQRGGK